MGLVPTLTQAGYALGILFLLPLGDRHDRRKLILMKSAALAVLLLLCSLTGQLSSLLIVSLLIGMAATMAQDIVPAAAILAPRASRENGGYGDDRPAAGDPAVADRQRLVGRYSAGG
jgi:MFS family permease